MDGPRALEGLRPGGALAIVRTHHVAGGSPGLSERAQEVCLRLDAEVTEPHALPHEESSRGVDDLASSDLVAGVEQHLSPPEITDDRFAFTGLQRTSSGVAAVDPADREPSLACLDVLVDDTGGHVTRRYRVELDLARRR